MTFTPSPRTSARSASKNPWSACLLAAGRGHFVVVSSVVGYVGTPQRSAYAASKHALHGFFEALRAEVRGDGVKVTMVVPGYVATDITLSALRGDGSAHGTRAASNAGGISAEDAARDIARAIERQPHEIHVGRGKEMLAIYLRRFTPRLLAEILPRIETT